MHFFSIAFAFSIAFFITIAQAGGPNCGPGYCLNFDGSGCHPCGVGFSEHALGKELSVFTKTKDIPIDAEWKKELYAFAQKNVVHPAWGFAHSERDYLVAKAIALKDGISMDEDVLFTAAYLHDIGGLAAFEKEDVDHAVRSVEVIEPLLQTWGFPMAKWPQVKEMILGHTYYGAKPNSNAALAFRDADILDFLGSIGVARILSVTQDAGFSDGTLKPTVSILKGFAESMAGKCSLQSCHELASQRLDNLKSFLSNLECETFGGQVL